LLPQNDLTIHFAVSALTTTLRTLVFRPAISVGVDFANCSAKRASKATSTVHDLHLWWRKKRIILDVECLQCGSENPHGKRFCGDCGVFLDPSGDSVRAQVKAIVGQELRRRDQKLLEIETADAIIDRIKSTFKPAMWTLALLVSVLGVLGFKSYRDALNAINSTKAQAVSSLQAHAWQQAQILDKEAAKQKETIENTAKAETAGIEDEAEKIRERYARLGNYDDIQARRKQAESTLQQEQAHVARLEEAGKQLREKYDSVGTQLAVIQNFQGPASPQNWAVQSSLPIQLTLTGTSTIISAGPQSLAAATSAWPATLDGFQHATLETRPSVTLLPSFETNGQSELRFASLGSAGADVERIQQRLKDLGLVGIDDSSCALTGAHIAANPTLCK
jgi:hypothetical protein